MTNSRMVTVIIPTYNGEDTIERAIKSVLEQSYTNRKLIIVDDESTDSTVKILQRYASEIKVIKQKNSGTASARNRGLEFAEGDYLAFLDQDDTWIRNKLELQVEIMEKYPSVGLTFGNLEAVDRNGRGLGFTVINHQRRHSPSWQDLLTSSMVPPSTVMTRRKLVEKIGGFDTTLKYGGAYADKDFALRLREISDFYFQDISLGTYCWDETRWPDYLKNLPAYAKKYWKHPHLQDPDNADLRTQFVQLCIQQVLSRSRILFRIHHNSVSYEMLSQLNRYHNDLKEIFGELYKDVSGLDSIDLKSLNINRRLSTLLFLYLCRSDLQKAFPEVFSGNFEGLIKWALNLVEGEYSDSDKEILMTNRKYLNAH